MDSIELIINIIIIGLLIPTIIYAYRLNKNLTLLRQNQSSLSKLIQSLNEATYKAENSIPKLKSATQSTSGELKEVVNSAKTLKDDLTFINERADNLADRLENVIHNSRKIKEAPQPSEAAPQSSNKKKEEKGFQTQISEQDAMRSEAELELLKALRAIK